MLRLTRNPGGSLHISWPSPSIETEFRVSQAHVENPCLGLTKRSPSSKSLTSHWAKCIWWSLVSCAICLQRRRSTIDEVEDACPRPGSPHVAFNVDAEGAREADDLADKEPQERCIGSCAPEIIHRLLAETEQGSLYNWKSRMVYLLEYQLIYHAPQLLRRQYMVNFQHGESVAKHREGKCRVVNGRQEMDRNFFLMDSIPELM